MVPLALALPIATNIAGKVASTVVDGIGSASKSVEAASKDKQNLEKARKTANDFESMFLENMFNYVFQDTGTDGPLGSNGTGGDVYKGMLVQQYAKQVSNSGGVGISNQIYDQLLKLQEQSNGSGA